VLETAILLLWAALQALSVIGVANYRRHVPRDGLIEGPPGVVVIAAVRGPWANAAAFVEAILAQDGVAPRLILAIGGEDDPEWPAIAALREAHPERIAIVVAGISDREGQKIHKLRAAVASLRAEDRYLVFLDTDIVPPPRLVGRLLFPIVRGKAGISTGYRILLPPARRPIAALVAAIDLQVATLPRLRALTPPWGGAMAMARATFDDLGVAEAWAGRLSDDLTLARVARAAKVMVRPVRDVLLASPMEGSSRAALAFAVRQYRHLVWNLPGAWWVAALILAVQGSGWLWALAAGGWPAIAVGYGAAWMRAALRVSVIQAVLPPSGRAPTRAALAWDCLLPFAVTWTHAACALAAPLSRRIRWGALDYRMGCRGRVASVLRRSG